LASAADGAIARIVWLLALLLLFSTAVRAQDFTYTINGGAVTITGYAGLGGAVVIPDSIEGLPVRVIWAGAFNRCTSLTSVTIPDSVTTIGEAAFYLCDNLIDVTIGRDVNYIADFAFYECASLTNITVDAANTSYSSAGGVLFNKLQTILILCPTLKSGHYTVPDSVITVRDYAFYLCTSLTSVTLGSSVTSIGEFAFYGCLGLTKATIGNSVSNLGLQAFMHCSGLTSVYFMGNAPAVGPSVFYGVNNAIFYYLPGTTGWVPAFANWPMALWNPTPQFTGPADPFGFTITGSSNLVIVVEAATSLYNPDWTPVSTNTLTDGSSLFSDPQWVNHPARYYRLRSP